MIKKDNRLTNRDISDNYRHCSFWLFPSDLLGEFANWVARQSKGKPFIIDKPLEAFRQDIVDAFPNPKIPTKVSYKELSNLIDDERFKAIPEILELNQMEGDWIDLGALARNVFYGVLREQITSGYYEEEKTINT